MKKEWKDATKRGDLEQVRLLLENGADINSKDGHSQTALMNAAHAGQVELVRLLIEKGAELDITAKYNLSALMLSLIAHHIEVTQLLIEAGANLNIQSSKNFYGGTTAFFLAEHGGHSEIVALLKRRGATS
jgi:ankyrin repeat protein